MGLFDRLFGRKKVEEVEETLTTAEVEEQLEIEEAPVISEPLSEPSEENISVEFTPETTEPVISSASETTREVEQVNEAVEDPVTVTAVDERQSDESYPTETVLEAPQEPVLNVEADASKQENLEAVAQYYAAKEAAAKRVEEAEATGTSATIETKQVEENSHVEDIKETETEKYSRSLKKTRTGFGAKLNEFFANFRSVDEDFFEELEELLILSDVGVRVASTLTEDLRYEAKLQNAKSSTDLRRVIMEKLVDIYEKDGLFNEAINMQNGLTVMLFVGVNGVGKTTSIGKLAYKYKQAGKKVMLVAADTFRAGAVAQLAEWGRRVDVPVVIGPEKGDPASVVFDGMERAVAEGVDLLMIDTAGRLQNKDNLMAELEKIGRIVKRVVPEAPHETLLAVDASTGQNALVQAKEFSKMTPLTGLVLTKIDGTARGGVVLAIREELDIPVKFIGFGEKIDDIGEFHSEDFIKGLLEGLV